jgi:hypothetical protein
MNGRATRIGVIVALVAVLVTAVRPGPVAGFSGFGTQSADATYGVEMVFDVSLPGGAPDRLEMLLRFTGSDEAFVAPVTATGTSARYRWDAAARPVTPNTRVDYQWRAIDGGRMTLSPLRTLLYDDDRPGLDWRTAPFGDATVHWYGNAESTARRFGEISSDAAARAEEFLGHRLAGPVDIFVYGSRDDFFGALGPGAREWTGAATFPWLRTIFMWLGGGSASFLETTIIHEVTHVVFQDATDNPFHEPAKWFNEGLATWSELETAAAERVVVASAASRGLLAFGAIRESFPIGDAAARLSYAQGTTMVQMIIDQYGEVAIADIAAAWQDGASDDEALEAGTGQPAGALYADYFASFGVAAPQPIEPAPILPSNVDLPPQPVFSGEPAPEPTATVAATPSPSAPGEQPTDGTALIALIVVAGLGTGAVVAMVRAGRRRSRSGP